LLGIGKRKAKEAVEEVVDEAVEGVTELVGEKLRDIFGTYVIERRTGAGEAVRRYEDGSVRIGKRQVTPAREK
jgi:hypothetical protein